MMKSQIHVEIHVTMPESDNMVFMICHEGQARFGHDVFEDHGSKKVSYDKKRRV